MKKRFLSIVLAVLMLVGIMPISAIAADAEPPAAQTGVSTKTSENTTGPKLEKSAQWVDEKAGIAKITIQVTGEQPTETTKKTDIVLVIDRSLSMTQNDRDWLKNAKKAAKAFAKKVLTDDPNVRIAVVAYAAKTINDWDFSSKLATVENNIDAINTNNGNWHGTNIQAGIHSARERLKKSDKDADKFMIVLADGAPNCRFGIYSASETWRLTSQQAADHHIKTDYREGGKQYFPNLYTADSNTFSYNNSDIMDEDSGYCYTATVSEAYAAKATDGITCYAIGIASGSSLINALMYSISSTDAGFVNAGTDENAITKVFSDIATDIQYKAHDVTLTDTMGAGFTYLANETYPSNPVVTPSADNKTVTWNVADKLGDETKTLTFYVQYDKQNLTDAETLPTNASASLSYEDNKGNEQPDITVASPEIENLAKKVTYVDENNTAYTDPAHQEKPHWYGDTVTLAPAPTKEGYTFNGWTTDDVTIGENDTFEMPKQAYRQQQSAYQQQNQQYYDPFGFWTSQTGSQDGQDPNQHYYRYTYTYQPGSRSDQNEQNTQYQWTYRRPRSGGIFRKIIGAYLLLQLLGWLFTSCAYSAYPSYYYGYSNQPDSGYSETYNQPSSGSYNSYGFGSGRQS